MGHSGSTEAKTRRDQIAAIELPQLGQKGCHVSTLSLRRIRHFAEVGKLIKKTYYGAPAMKPKLYTHNINQVSTSTVCAEQSLHFALCSYLTRLAGLNRVSPDPTIQDIITIQFTSLSL